MAADYFYILLGMIPLASGLCLVIRDSIHAKYGYRTEGKVVEMVGKWEISGGTLRYYHYPIIQFTTELNESKELLMDVGSNFGLYSEGEWVQIVYYKNNIYPDSWGWKAFYVLLTLSGLGIILYQLLK